ncbi:MAG: GtrA family protein [Actinobacteria bacterium]|nr:GtrA family protein [Actinomycetota bacterium]
MLRRIIAARVELMKFGSVGALAYIVNLGLFNLLVHFPISPLDDRPVTGSLLAGIVSILVAYFGNRFWTWKDRPRRAMSREISLFFIINGIGILMSAAVLFISRYILGFQSALADNIAANVIGIGLGTIFRFWSYRVWVFPRT